MKTLLVLGEHPALAEAISSQLNPEQFRVVHRLEFADAEPLLAPGLVTAICMDVEFAQVQAVWTLEKVVRRVPGCPIILYAAAQPWEWEEEAYLLGVSHVLTKPVRGRLLNALLDRFLHPGPEPAAPSRTSAPTRPVAPEVRPADTSQSPHRVLEILSDFSSILSHSLSAEALPRQFLLLLREIIGINRAAIFLRQPSLTFGSRQLPEEIRRLRSACAIGLAPGLLEHFELSLEAGIGRFVYREGRILKRESPEAQADIGMQKEFELLGAQVAVPVLDRESLVGVAVFDGRVTGDPLQNGELQLIFHLLEQLGLAIRNIWLHDQMTANQEMMADILQQLSSACVVIGRDLTILHANKTARALFGRAGRRSEPDFSDLPQLLGAKIYQVLKSGAAIATFRYSPPERPEAIYQVSLMPFQKQGSVLMLVDDVTQAEQLRKLESEAGNLRLMRTIGERLAHEIGNTLVPLSTHQQLLADKFKEPEFRASLEHALADGVKRIGRLVNQMKFLARDSVPVPEAIPLEPLIEEAFREAQLHQPSESSLLRHENARQPVVLSGDKAALRLAFTEVMLNALQANPPNPQVSVRTRAETDAKGRNWVHVEVRDNGSGFTPELARRVPEPFFTTRNVGLGLGLTVTRKILETHRGRLEITPAEPGAPGMVRLSLPAEGN
jgi:nitrogen-specific signal transduction histidine kinase/DNA-binding NarL/FixJ family response regulator